MSTQSPCPTQSPLSTTTCEKTSPETTRVSDDAAQIRHWHNTARSLEALLRKAENELAKVASDLTAALAREEALRTQMATYDERASSMAIHYEKQLLEARTKARATDLVEAQRDALVEVVRMSYQVLADKPANPEYKQL